MYEKTECKNKLPVKKQYIHAAIAKNSFWMVVMMHANLVTHIHTFHFIAVDYTFKQIIGEFNAGTVAGFSPHYQ